MNDEHEIREMLAELYTPDEIEVWLTSPHPQLDGQRAADVIAAGEGERVKQVIQRLLDCVYI